MMQTEATKVFLRATLPPELLQPFLQHIRDFDAAHPGCRFQVCADAGTDESMADMVERLRVDPALTFTKIFNRMR
jgi:hypothetical protein